MSSIEAKPLCKKKIVCLLFKPMERNKESIQIKSWKEEKKGK